MNISYFVSKPYHPELIGPGTGYKDKIDWLEANTVKIGLRTDAGNYCFKCKQTLCSDGPKFIHSGRSDWFDHCPKCQTQAPPDGSNAAGDVRWAKSFFWETPRDELKKMLKNKRGQTIVGSDNRYFTLKAFLDLVDKSQFHFDSGGQPI